MLLSWRLKPHVYLNSQSVSRHAILFVCSVAIFFLIFQILDKDEKNQGRIHVHYIPGSYYSNHDKHELKEVAVFQSKIFVWPSGLS